MRQSRSGKRSRRRSGNLAAFICIFLSALMFLGAMSIASRISEARLRGSVPQARPGVIPLPAAATLNPLERYELSSAGAIYVDGANGEARRVAEQLSELIRNLGGPQLPVRESAPELPAGRILLASGGAAAGPGAEGYELEITAGGITLRAPAPAGLYYGVQTLRQMLPPPAASEAAGHRLTLPTARITDAPRFSWRGAMLDVARHFRTVTEVKRYIDLMAHYKLNRLHIHLTDDQGWRIQIKAWPRLTKIGAQSEVGGGPGGYYTQEEYAEIVRYARERYITVVPEIDVPGHTNAALASIPELNCNGVAPPPYSGVNVGFSTLCIEKELTYSFIDDVIREVAALTPGPYIHFGGDEARALTHAEHAAFVRRVERIIRRYGKQPIGWDEIAISRSATAGTTEAPPTDGQASLGAGKERRGDGTIVQWWQPGSRASEAVTELAQDGARVIVSPAHRFYLDMKYDRTTAIGQVWAGITTTQAAYSAEPAELLPEVPESAILGVEAALWSETAETMADVEHLAFPRLAGVAEIGWSPASALDWREYRVRLGEQGPRWNAMRLNFYRAPEVPWVDEAR